MTDENLEEMIDTLKKMRMAASDAVVNRAPSDISSDIMKAYQRQGHLLLVGMEVLNVVCLCVCVCVFFSLSLPVSLSFFLRVLWDICGG